MMKLSMCNIFGHIIWHYFMYIIIHTSCTRLCLTIHLTVTLAILALVRITATSCRLACSMLTYNILKSFSMQVFIASHYLN